MNTLRFFVLFFLLMINVLATSQSLSPTVISTSGGFAITPSGSISHTTGELAAIETYVSGDVVLTQGFQQPWLLPPNSTPEILEGFRFAVFPNPTDGQGTLFVDYPEGLDLRIHVRDIIGREFVYTELHHEGPRSLFPFHIQSAASGTYVLTLTAIHPPTHDTYRFHQILILTK